MNADRRKRLTALAEKLDEIRSQLEDITTEEEEALENIPENLQETERYETMDEIVADLQDTTGELEEMYDRIIEITEK